MNHKNDMITIDTLSPGERATVESVEDSPLSGRLKDLGLISGTSVRCLYRAPFGDPTAYEIRGAVIALRRADSRCVLARNGVTSHG